MNRISLNGVTDSKWQSHPTQTILREDIVEIEGQLRHDNSWEFELASQHSVIFDLACGFNVDCSFMVYKDSNDTVGQHIPMTELPNILLQRNWFEHLISECTVLHKNNSLNFNDFPIQCEPFLNTLLYAYMDPITKSFRGQEQAHPIHTCVPGSSKWLLTNDESKKKYKEYALHIYDKNQVNFLWKPLHWFPFDQNSDIDNPSKLYTPLPMKSIGKLNVRLRLHKNSEKVFFKKPIVTPRTSEAPQGETDAARRAREEADRLASTLTPSPKIYKIVINKISLVFKELVLNPMIEQRLMSSGKTMYFPGVSKYGSTENVPAGLSAFTANFKKLPFPEGILIFALPNASLSDQYNFNNATTLDKVLMAHNVDYYDFKVKNSNYTLRQKNFGQISDEIIAKDLTQNYLIDPPMGVPFDMSLINYNTVLGGFKYTDYPHIYIDLKGKGNNSRKVPLGDNSGEMVKEMLEMSVTLYFKPTSNAGTYYFIFYFSDIICSYNIKDGIFKGIYKDLVTVT